MRTTNYTIKNYTENTEVYQLKLPLELDGLIPEDDSVRLLSQILEELDYTKLYQAYSAKGRNPAVDPKTMFKILVYAYSQNIYSSHKIETSCRRDITLYSLVPPIFGSAIEQNHLLVQVRLILMEVLIDIPANSRYNPC